MSYITACFSRRTAISPLLARIITVGARWSHCGVVVDGDVIEARAFYGVTPTPIDQWKKRYASYTFVQIEVPDPEASHRFAIAQVGKKYDWLGCISAPWRSHWQSEASWYCSELVEACVVAGNRVRWRLSVSGVTPMDVWNCK